MVRKFLGTRFAQALGHALSWFFLVAVGLSAIEVVMRYVFDRPSSWSNPTVTTICAVAFAIGGAYTMAEDGHVRISILVERLPSAIQRSLRLCALCIGGFYLSGLAWGLWLQAQESVLRFGSAGWQPELTPGPPDWPLPAIGKGWFFLAAILFLIVLIERLAAMMRSGN